MMACISVAVLFSLIDPETLLPHGDSVEIGNIYVYSIAFFIFWILGAIASGLTALLMCKSK